MRLSGVGPVAAGFWRLALALPFLFVIAALTGQPVHWPGRKLAVLVAVAAFFFAADLAAWHAGIHMTKLGNATLFGNVSSFAFAAWGLWLARRWPSPMQGCGARPRGDRRSAADGQQLRAQPAQLHGRPARACSPACSTPAI